MADLWNLWGAQNTSKSDGKPPTPSQGVLPWLRKLVGWPGAPAAKDTPAESELVRERVRAGPQGIVLPWFLPYFDDQQTLSENQAMRFAYRRMLADPNVKAAMFGKILAACSLDLKIIPRDRKNKQQGADAELVRWNLEDALEGGVPGLIWSVLSGALVDGYSVSEKIWARENQGEHKGAYFLRAVKPKDTGRDVILQTDEFRNTVGVMGMRFNSGISYHPSNFLIYRHLPMWDVATGMSDLRAAYGSWWMLDTVKKLRAMGLEKRALPVIVGHYTNTQERTAVENSLALVKSQNWLAVPETVRVDALSIAGSADAMFDSAIRQLAEDIFLAIAGATLQARQGDVNNARGSSAEHRNTADLFIAYLVNAIAQLLNDRRKGLVKDILDLNRVVEVYPKATLAALDEKDMVARLAIYTGLWEIGIQTSREAIYDEFNVQPPDANDPKDSLGGKADQEAQVAAATIAAPGGPAGAAAADRVLTDATSARGNDSRELTDPMQVAGGESPDGALEMVEHVGQVGHDWNDGKGIDAPTSTGASVDAIGRHYAVVNGRRVPLPEFTSARHRREWVQKHVEPLAQRDSGKPWRGPSGKWFRHDGERVVQCAAPQQMAEPPVVQPIPAPPIPSRPAPARPASRRVELTRDQAAALHNLGGGDGHELASAPPAPPLRVRTPDEDAASRGAPPPVRPPLPKASPPVRQLPPPLPRETEEEGAGHAANALRSLGSLPGRARQASDAAGAAIDDAWENPAAAAGRLYEGAMGGLRRTGAAGARLIDRAVGNRAARAGKAISDAAGAPRRILDAARHESGNLADAAAPRRAPTTQPTSAAAPPLPPVAKTRVAAGKLRSLAGRASPAQMQKIGEQLTRAATHQLRAVASHLFGTHNIPPNASRQTLLDAIHDGMRHGFGDEPI